MRYSTSLDGVTASALAGFFEGWPNPPSPETHVRILRGSDHVVVAWDDDRVVGFINAISDGVLSAYIPLLEVRSEYRGRGIGLELTRRMLDTLKGLYMIDLICDANVQPFYEKAGMQRMTGMVVRNAWAEAMKRRSDGATQGP